MSHHGREYEDCDQCTIAWHALNLNRYGTAVELIKAIANGYGEDGYTGNYSTMSAKQACDNWLENNGFESEASRKRQREKRAEELDKEIARLQKERSEIK